MTIELETSVRAEEPARPAAAGPLARLPISAGAGSERVWLGRAGIATVALALAAWAFAPFILTALDAARHHRVFTGVAGYFPQDGLQYLAFVRDGHDGLIRNLFGLSGGAVFVHPIWSVTGLVQGLTGVGPALIMAFWKLVSVAVLLAGAVRLVARHVPASRPGRRTTAVALCLFGGFTPVALLWSRNFSDLWGATIDLIPAAALWDYAPTAIAIGLMPFAIEGMDHIVAGTGSRRTELWTAACCLIIGWLHPWQAATLMIVWLGLLLWRRHEDREAPSAGTRVAVESAVRWRPILAIFLATAAAPLYYACLSHVDFSWAQFSKMDTRYLMINWPVLEYCIAPLVVVALLCARSARRDRGLRSLVVWTLATIVVIALRPPEQYHALDGFAFPLGVLVVRAWPASRGLSVARLAAIAGVAALAGTFAIFAANSLHSVQSPQVTSYSELDPSDVRAVAVAARADGGRPILSTATLGSAIPMLADASTWVGNFLWTPGGLVRTREADDLFQRSLAPVAVRQIVLSTDARALVEPCHSAARLKAVLAPLGFREQVVGCARVYIRGGSRPG